jgi:small conductance mechanosensitive channel
MRVDISALWAKLQAMFDRALVLLPNLVLGALVFVLFLFAGKGVRALGIRIASRARKHRNVGLVLGGLFRARRATRSSCWASAPSPSASPFGTS